jgi:hypothetical protein
MNEAKVIAIVSRGLVTEKKYREIFTWYRQNPANHWLGSYGVDRGNIYCFINNYNKENQKEYRFYLLDSYYLAMNDYKPVELIISAAQAQRLRDLVRREQQNLSIFEHIDTVFLPFDEVQEYELKKRKRLKIMEELKDLLLALDAELLDDQ